MSYFEGTPMLFQINVHSALYIVLQVNTTVTGLVQSGKVRKKTVIFSEVRRVRES